MGIQLQLLIRSKTDQNTMGGTGLDSGSGSSLVWGQGREARDEIRQREHNMRRAVPIRGLELVNAPVFARSATGVSLIPLDD
jgi:hypothetical protein